MSEAIEQLARNLAVPLRRQGSLRLIRWEDFSRFVDECASKGLLILGIEAFHFCDGKVVPEMEMIADFSKIASNPSPESCVAAASFAKLYFERAKDRNDLWFEFVLKECDNSMI